MSSICAPVVITLGKRKYRKNSSYAFNGNFRHDILEQQKQQHARQDTSYEYDETEASEETPTPAAYPVQDQQQPKQNKRHQSSNNNKTPQSANAPPGLSKKDENPCKVTINIPAIFHGRIIGRKGETLKQLQRDTKTTIRVPPQNSRRTNVVIEGATEEAVDSCRTRIELLVDAASAKASPTHFLCIPLVDPRVAQGIEAFKQEALELVAETSGDSSLTPEMFSSVASMHLTLGVLKVFSREQTDRAIALLRQCRTKLVLPWLAEQQQLQLQQIQKTKQQQTTKGADDPGPLLLNTPKSPEALPPIAIRLQGIEYMNDDPSEVDVLYAKVECPGLQELVDNIVKTFVEADLLEPETKGEGKHVKLHATLINSKRNRDEEGKRISFDARAILDHFEDHEFGTCSFNAIHLSKMKTAKSGFYICEYQIKF
eukprot:m.36247 g.36247  ORF g.36247 m.36247 type:complete len:428 (+) comp15959_c0_seq1:58-1341(+)